MNCLWDPMISSVNVCCCVNRMDVERNTGRYNLRPGRCFSREEMEKKMRSKEHRLQTFTKHWPHHSSVTLSAECMARAGFYYEGEGDRVTCAFCREWLDHWEKDDVPHIQHKLKSPNCKFVTGQEVQKTGEAEDMDTEQECVAPKWDAARQCIPFISNQPAFQQYVNSEERKHTFNTWGLSVKTPDELIDAGFFYTKCEDEVRCFYCSVTLKQWNPNDQPWVEHARESPTCPFVLREHGSFFVDQVIQRENIREFKSQLTKEAKERGHTDHDIKQALHNNGEYFRNADEMRAMVVDQLQEAQGAITEEPADDVEDEYREGKC